MSIKGLSWEPSAYNLDVMKVERSPAEIKREYTRLRKNFMERMRKIDKAGLSESVPKTYLFRRSQYQPASKLSETKMRLALRDLAAAMQSPYTTKSGIKSVREKQLAAYHEHGYKFINKQNLNRFNEFMQFAHVLGMNRIYDSKRAVQWFRNHQAGELSETEMLNQFEKWVKDQEGAQRTSGAHVTAETLRRGLK